MSFRLFGFDVEVQTSFWLTSALFGFLVFRENLALVLAWTVVVFVSVLVHELGHAVMIRRLGIEPQIALHGMGGTTSWQQVLPVSRAQRIVISVAGPFAGFAFAAVVYGVERVLPGSVGAQPLVAVVLSLLFYVNLLWGAINLLPVLPFDGGHVLEHALGPRRFRWTLLISTIVGFGAAAVFAVGGRWWAAMLFGMAAIGSFARWRSEPAVRRVDPVPARTRDAMASATRSALTRAREALDDGQLERAIELAEGVLAQRELEGKERRREPVPDAARAALEIIAWSHLGAGRIDDAAFAVGLRAGLGDPDRALVAAIALERGQRAEARTLLEMARARGDDRKEVFGPLIRILLEQGEVARAAAVALVCFDGLSTDDARTIADAAWEARAYAWSARLRDAAFARDRSPEDAYAAARAHAQDGAFDAALTSLSGAVGSGFADTARAWSDAALAPLRASPRASALEELLPRP
jgi:Zn-dependent protease